MILLILPFVNFKDKLIPIVLKMDNVNYGYEESRGEQARLHEEVAQRETALRDTRIRNVHDVEELKRAQKVRIDEFSRNELREKSRYSTGAYFTNKGVAGKDELCE